MNGNNNNFGTGRRKGTKKGPSMINAYEDVAPFNGHNTLLPENAIILPPPVAPPANVNRRRPLPLAVTLSLDDEEQHRISPPAVSSAKLPPTEESTYADCDPGGGDGSGFSPNTFATSTLPKDYRVKRLYL